MWRRSKEQEELKKKSQSSVNINVKNFLRERYILNNESDLFEYNN